MSGLGVIIGKQKEIINFKINGADSYERSKFGNIIKGWKWVKSNLQ